MLPCCIDILLHVAGDQVQTGAIGIKGLYGFDVSDMVLNWGKIEIIQSFFNFCSNCVKDISLSDKLSLYEASDVISKKLLSNIRLLVTGWLTAYFSFMLWFLWFCYLKDFLLSFGLLLFFNSLLNRLLNLCKVFINWRNLSLLLNFYALSLLKLHTLAVVLAWSNFGSFILDWNIKWWRWRWWRQIKMRNLLNLLLFFICYLWQRGSRWQIKAWETWWVRQCWGFLNFCSRIRRWWRRRQIQSI